MNTQACEAHALIEDEYAVMLIGRDHRVSYANARAHELLGYEGGGLHGLSIEQLLVATRRPEVRNVQAVMVGQAPRRWRSAMRSGKGGSVDVQVLVEPCLDDRGAVVAVKVQCETWQRSRPPAMPVSARSPVMRPTDALPERPQAAPTFDPASGTRPIPAHKRSQPPAKVQPRRPGAEPAPEDPSAQLETALQLIGWLRQRLHTADEALHDPRERERMEYVLSEMAELVAEVRCGAARTARKSA